MGLGVPNMSDDDGERSDIRTRPAKAARVVMNSGKETIRRHDVKQIVNETERGS